MTEPQQHRLRATVTYTAEYPVCLEHLGDPRDCADQLRAAMDRNGRVYGEMARTVKVEVVR